MTDIIIKAGEKWTRGGVTIEWLKDFRRGDVMELDAMLVNGDKPTPDDPVPAGFFSCRLAHGGWRDCYL